MQISSDDQLLLVAKAKDGDNEAVRLLIECNMPFIKGMATNFSRFDNDMRDDMIQYGAAGILKAIPKFNLEKGVLFLTYAGRVIRNEMIRCFRLHEKQRRVPIAENSHVRLGDLSYTDNPLDAMIEKEQRELDQAAINKEAATLKPRAQNILKMRMSGMTLDAIGSIYEITKERARQVVNQSKVTIAENIASGGTR